MPVTLQGENASFHVYRDYNDYGTQNNIQITNSGVNTESPYRYLTTSDAGVS